MLIDGVAFDGLIADEALDRDAIIADVDARTAAAAVMSRHPRRIGGDKLDATLYERRHLIEKVFCGTQRGQTHRHARMQDRPKRPSHDSPCRRRHHQQPSNLDKPMM